MSSYAPAFYFLSVAFVISSCLLFIPSLYFLTSNISLFYSSFPVSSSYSFAFPLSSLSLTLFSLMCGQSTNKSNFLFLYPFSCSGKPLPPRTRVLRPKGPQPIQVFSTFHSVGSKKQKRWIKTSIKVYWPTFLVFPVKLGNTSESISSTRKILESTSSSRVQDP